MGDPDESAGAESADKRKTDRRAKALFLAGILVVMGVVYFVTKPGKTLLGRRWGQDLAQAVRQAAAERRRVVALFTADPMSAEAQRLITNTINKYPNPKNLEEGRFVCVHVGVSSDPKDPTRQQYKILTLPTVLLLDPNGVEINRREGMVGQIPFSQGFLDGSEVHRPKGS